MVFSAGTQIIICLLSMSLKDSSPIPKAEGTFELSSLVSMPSITPGTRTIKILKNETSLLSAQPCANRKHSDQPSSCLRESDILVEGTWKVTPDIDQSFAA